MNLISTEPEATAKVEVDQNMLARIEHFMELKHGDGLAFTRKEAEILARVQVIDEVKDAKDPTKTKQYKRPIHVSGVRKMLEGGCHPKMVIRILGD